MEKEEVPVPRDPAEVMVKGSAVPPLKHPATPPLTEHWQRGGLPTTDVLLPSPASLAFVPTDTITPTSLPTTSDDATEPEEWLREAPSDVRREMVTISSQLENGRKSNKESSLRGTEQREKNAVAPSSAKAMSAEAIHVVEALPDLSFLSARKLMYAANENMSRFQTTARP